MNSIGLFGDSYAGDKNIPSYKWHWSTLLSKELNKPIVNYGKAASSIYYSYEQFVNNYETHDLNIFLVTEPNRYISPVKTTSGEMYITNITYLETKKPEIFINPAYKDIHGWFIASDHKYNREVAKLFLEKIISLDKNIILIPCFKESIILDYDWMPVVLWELYCENISWYTNMNIYKFIETHVESQNNISGHFSEEMNINFFKVILEKIKTGKWNCDFKKPDQLKYKLEQLYIKRGEKI